MKVYQQDNHHPKSYKVEPQQDLKDSPFLGFVHLFSLFLQNKFTQNHLVSNESKAKGGWVLSPWLYLESLGRDAKVPTLSLTAHHLTDFSGSLIPITILALLPRKPSPLPESGYQRLQLVLFALSWPLWSFYQTQCWCSLQKMTKREGGFHAWVLTHGIASYVSARI